MHYLLFARQAEIPQVIVSINGTSMQTDPDLVNLHTHAKFKAHTSVRYFIDSTNTATNSLVISRRFTTPSTVSGPLGGRMSAHASRFERTRTIPSL